MRHAAWSASTSSIRFECLICQSSISPRAYNILKSCRHPGRIFVIEITLQRAFWKYSIHGCLATRVDCIIYASTSFSASTHQVGWVFCIAMLFERKALGYRVRVIHLLTVVEVPAENHARPFTVHHQSSRCLCHASASFLHQCL